MTSFKSLRQILLADTRGTWKVGLKAVPLHQLGHHRMLFAYDSWDPICQFITGASPSPFLEASYVLNNTNQIVYGLIFILFQPSLFFVKCSHRHSR